MVLFKAFLLHGSQNVIKITIIQRVLTCFNENSNCFVDLKPSLLTPNCSLMFTDLFIAP